MKDELSSGSTEANAILRMGDSIRQLSNAFSAAMEAQTAQLVRLSEKVDNMNARVIRLEEQHHAQDIQDLGAEVEKLKASVRTLELMRAKGEGMGVLLRWVKDFSPWVVAVALAAMVAAGFERKP
jgi:hypothetical protein